MKRFLSVKDVEDPISLASEALELKKSPLEFDQLGKDKVLGMVFFNPSLRTRMSTTKAAYNLGLHVMTINVTSDSWQLETAEGIIMDSGKAEHVKEAAAVMGSYCDILAVRSFPTLKDQEEDYKEELMTSFAKYCGVPIISLESATLHPLQSLADLMTIMEYASREKPKIVLTWAPHVRELPQSVPNSFAQWINKSSFDLTIVHPEGMELDNEFSKGAQIMHDQDEALKGADFVYVKNWSSFNDYGSYHEDPSWQITMDKMGLTNNARLMHCLPVRRNVVIDDTVLDSNHSIVIELAHNRVYSAQVVLKKMLEAL